MCAPPDPSSTAASPCPAPLRQRLGAAARDMVTRRLSWDRAARTFEESYAAAAALDAR